MQDLGAAQVLCLQLQLEDYYYCKLRCLRRVWEGILRWQPGVYRGNAPCQKNEHPDRVCGAPREGFCSILIGCLALPGVLCLLIMRVVVPTHEAGKHTS